MKKLLFLILLFPCLLYADPLPDSCWVWVHSDTIAVPDGCDHEWEFKTTWFGLVQPWCFAGMDGLWNSDKRDIDDIPIRETTIEPFAAAGHNSRADTLKPIECVKPGCDCETYARCRPLNIGNSPIKGLTIGGQ